MKIEELLFKALPVMKERFSDRIDKKCDEGDVKIYWAGTILRIDIKFNEGE